MGHVADFEINLDRLVLRMADAYAFQPRAGAKRQRRIGYQDAGAIKAHIHDFGVEGEHAHAHFAAHGCLGRYRDAGGGAPLLHRDHHIRQRGLDARLAAVHGRMRRGSGEGELGASMVANQR
jgi:hypothetical protein